MADSEQSPSRRPAWLKVAMVVAIASGLLAAKFFGVFEQLGSPAALAKSLVDLGVWGYLAFIVTYALLQPFGVPGTVFIVAAPLIWPWPVAFALSLTGTMCASVIGFSFARFVARDWISPRIPQRFRAFDAAIEKRGFWTVALLRLIFWMPPLLHATFGISKVRFWTHFWGSLVGYLLPIFLVSFFGEKIVQAMKNATPATWASIGGGLVALILSVWLYKRRSRAKAQRRLLEGESEDTVLPAIARDRGDLAADD